MAMCTLEKSYVCPSYMYGIECFEFEILKLSRQCCARSDGQPDGSACAQMANLAHYSYLIC